LEGSLARVIGQRTTGRHILGERPVQERILQSPEIIGIRIRIRIRLRNISIRRLFWNLEAHCIALHFSISISITLPSTSCITLRIRIRCGDTKAQQSSERVIASLKFDVSNLSAANSGGAWPPFVPRAFPALLL